MCCAGLLALYPMYAQVCGWLYTCTSLVGVFMVGTCCVNPQSYTTISDPEFFKTQSIIFAPLAYTIPKLHMQRRKLVTVGSCPPKIHMRRS